jgi:hypothetical protein
MADKTPNKPGKRAQSSLKEKRSAKRAQKAATEDHDRRDRG